MNDRVARLMRPEHVAVIGVSPGSIGEGTVANLERFGFSGPIHLVSRKMPDRKGRRCLASIDELPLGVDAAILCVPRDAVLDSVSACVRRGVGAVVIFAAGFAEAGESGVRDQRRLAEVARESGIAILGPNCTGLTNYVDGVVLCFVHRALEKVSGKPALSIIGQSGGMVGNVLHASRARGVPVAYAIATGNEVDRTAEDFLAYVLNDGRRGPIAIFAEQLRQPAYFLELARLAREQRRPIVLLHPGRSAAARESARSHTGALAADYALMKALVSAEAVTVVETLDEFVDVCVLLTCFPEPSGKGAAVITDSGAFKGLALDFCNDIGLDVPALAPATVAALEARLPPFAPATNPLDVTAQGLRDTGLYAASTAALLADPAVGALVAAVLTGPPAMVRTVGESVLAEMVASKKPSAYAVMGGPAPVPGDLVAAFNEAGVPFFRSPERALRAMAHVVRYGRARMRVPRRIEGHAAIAPVPIGGALGEYHAKAVLAAAGILVPRGGLATELAAALSIAMQVGYPVVLKAHAPALLHKTEAGGVHVGIADEAALTAAWNLLNATIAERRPDIVLDGILVESMALPGIECVVGARRDPQWGAALLVGLGGIWVEALADVRLLPIDASADEVEEQIGSLRASAVLTAGRGSQSADIPALVDVVLRLGSIMAATPELAEIEINPLVVYPRGQGALALDALMMGAPASPNHTIPSSSP